MVFSASSMALGRDRGGAPRWDGAGRQCCPSSSRQAAAQAARTHPAPHRPPDARRASASLRARPPPPHPPLALPGGPQGWVGCTPVEAPVDLPAAPAQEQDSGQHHESATDKERQDHHQQHVVVEDGVRLRLWAGRGQDRWGRPPEARPSPPRPAAPLRAPSLTVGLLVVLSHLEVRAAVAAVLAAAVAMVGVGCILKLGGGAWGGGGTGRAQTSSSACSPSRLPGRGSGSKSPQGGGDSRRGGGEPRGSPHPA